ncbi:unnamed protein product [Vitrella brassicaformis CCMP3155]|uniref:SKP1 component POZ domain-containing protein n=2 Tax=Vitrella brassicaformis TaxID=1169539 RepID=A0A0G4G263_VITBC|nr:unnamed protein product [Vitrella brassicaformis CCMP3155]|eukprot:CEM22146.1 unnamed protein product [Vitrella brassicaformis CCMP3155]
MTVVRLQAEDGAVEVEEKAARLSKTIDNILEEPDGEGGGEVPLHNIRRAILEKVMQWCKYVSEHHDDDNEAPQPIQETLITTVNTVEEVFGDEWDVTCVEEMDWETLCDVVKAASYLHIPRLIQIAQTKIALYLRTESSPLEIAILVNKAKAVSKGASREDGGQERRLVGDETTDEPSSSTSREPGLRQPLLAFASIPYDVLASTLALLPLDLLAAAAGASLTPVDTRVWEVLAVNYTDLIIDYNDASATFFEKLSFAAAYEWGRRLPHLRSITVRHPRLLAAWCLRVVIGIVEGHAEARAALVAGRRKSGRPIPEGSLESITFEPDEDDGDVWFEEDDDDAERGPLRPAGQPPHTPPQRARPDAESMKERAAVNKALSLLPSRPSPASAYLPAVRSITGLDKEHRPMADREWRMPALDTVTETAVMKHDRDRLDVATLGKIIQTSERLQELVVTMAPDPLVDALSMIQRAAEGEEGRLAGLRTIGTLLMTDGGAVLAPHPSIGLTHLKDVLHQHGCLSLDHVDVELRPIVLYGPALRDLVGGLDSFHKAFGGPIIAFRTPPPSRGYFMLHANIFQINSLLDVPDDPSTLLIETFQHLAQRTRKMEIYVTTEQLLDYHQRGAVRPAVQRVADSLTFSTTEMVVYGNFVPAGPGWNPGPAFEALSAAERAAALRGLVSSLIPQPRLPSLRKISIVGDLAGGAGAVLAEKATRLQRLDGREGPVFEVLRAIGRDGEVETTKVSISLASHEPSQEGLTWRDWADELPKIDRIDVKISSAVKPFFRGVLDPLLKANRFRRLTVHVSSFPYDPRESAIRREMAIRKEMEACCNRHCIPRGCFWWVDHFCGKR